jgi:hypothetical protein
VALWALEVVAVRLGLGGGLCQALPQLLHPQKYKFSHSAGKQAGSTIVQNHLRKESNCTQILMQVLRE